MKTSEGERRLGQTGVAYPGPLAGVPEALWQSQFPDLRDHRGQPHKHRRNHFQVRPVSLQELLQKVQGGLASAGKERKCARARDGQSEAAHHSALHVRQERHFRYTETNPF